MKFATLRTYALSLPEVTEEPHHQSGSFRVRGKIFVTIPPEQTHVHVFVSEEQRERALTIYPEQGRRAALDARQRAFGRGKAADSSGLGKQGAQSAARVRRRAWFITRTRHHSGRARMPCATNTPVSAKTFELLRGAELLTAFESSPGKQQMFCSTCGSPIYGAQSKLVADTQCVAAACTPAKAANKTGQAEKPWLRRPAA